MSLHLTAPALFLILFSATPPAFPLFGSHTLFRRGSGVPRRGVSRCVRPGDSGGDLWGVVNVGSREGSYLEPQISWTFLWPGHIGRVPHALAHGTRADGRVLRQEGVIARVLLLDPQPPSAAVPELDAAGSHVDSHVQAGVRA